MSNITKPTYEELVQKNRELEEKNRELNTKVEHLQSRIDRLNINSYNHLDGENPI